MQLVRHLIQWLLLVFFALPSFQKSAAKPDDTAVAARSLPDETVAEAGKLPDEISVETCSLFQTDFKMSARLSSAGSSELPSDEVPPLSNASTMQSQSNQSARNLSRTTILKVMGLSQSNQSAQNLPRNTILKAMGLSQSNQSAQNLSRNNFLKDMGLNQSNQSAQNLSRNTILKDMGLSQIAHTKSPVKLIIGLTVTIVTALTVFLIANEKTDFAIAKAPNQYHIFAGHLFHVFMVGVDYAYIIPLAYDVAQELDAGAFTSGLFTGVDGAGAVFGQLFAFFAWRLFPYSQVRTWLVCVPTLVILSLFVPAAAFASRVFPKSVLIGILVGSRVVSGFCYSSMGLFGTLTAAVADVQVKQLMGLLALPFLLVGTGLGPGVTSGVAAILKAASGGASSTNQSAIDIMCACMCLLMFAYASFAIPISCMLPKNLEFQNKKEEANEDSVANLPPKDETQKKMWFGVVCFSLGLNHFVFNCVESGTALLMEVEFGFEPMQIGFGMSVIFCVTMVTTSASAFLQVFEWEQTALYFDRTIMCMLVPGCAILFKTPIWGDPAPWYQIYLADLLLYPATMVIFAISFGMLLTKAGPKGTWNSYESVVLLLYLIHGIVRTPAAPSMRLVIDWGGRNAYATAVSLVTAAGTAIAIIGQSKYSSSDDSIAAESLLETSKSQEGNKVL